MRAWLYQMTIKEGWGPANYRAEVWEGRLITWPAKTLVHAENRPPEPGDLILLFFAPSSKEPGVYGLGVITRHWPRRRTVQFRLCPPSDQLKTDPIWSPSLKRWANRVRGAVPRGTMWVVSAEDLQYVRGRVRARLAAG